MKKNLLSLFSAALLFLLGSLVLSCSQQDQVKPRLDQTSGARSGIDSLDGNDAQLLVEPPGSENRGRIQMQGIDITVSPEPSWAWARTDNVTKSEAIYHLNDLYNNLTTRQRQDRAEALQKAINFINAGPYTVVGNAIIRPFKNSNPRDNSIRIDIEIRAGTAFTD